MDNKYKSFFLLPIGTSKVLDDSGWLFETHQRISQNVLAFLVEKLRLEKTGSDNGICYYQRIGLKINVLSDENGYIEEIYIRVFSTMDNFLLRKVLHSSEVNNVELFDPNSIFSPP